MCLLNAPLSEVKVGHERNRHRAVIMAGVRHLTARHGGVILNPQPQSPMAHPGYPGKHRRNHAAHILQAIDKGITAKAHRAVGRKKAQEPIHIERVTTQPWSRTDASMVIWMTFHSVSEHIEV